MPSVQTSLQRAVLHQSKPLEPVRGAGAIVLAHNASIMSFRLDNAMSGGSLFVFLLPGSASLRAPEKLPPSALSSPAFPFAFPPYPFSRVFAFPFPQPRVARSFQTDVALRLSARAGGNYYRLRYSPSRDGVCVRQMSCKKFSLGAKDALPCFRVYPNARGTNEDMLLLNRLGQARGEQEQNEDTFSPRSRRRSTESN